MPDPFNRSLTYLTQRNNGVLFIAPSKPVMSWYAMMINKNILYNQSEEKVGHGNGVLARERREEERERYKKKQQRRNEKNKAVESSVVEAEIKDTIDPTEELELVVFPWELHNHKHKKVGDGTVILESKAGNGVFKIATHADNLVGSGVLRRELERPGTVSLPETWKHQEYVEKACSVLVAEAIGKNDMELRLLVPRGVALLKQYVEPWPGASEDVMNYLLSGDFLNKCIAFQGKRMDNYRDVLRIKLMKVAATIGASRVDVEMALWWFNHPFLSQVVATLLLPMLIGIIGMMVISYCDLWMSLSFAVLFVLAPTMYAVCVYKAVYLWAHLVTGKVLVHYGSLVSIFPSCSKGIELPKLLNVWKFRLVPGDQDKACDDKKPYSTFGSFIDGVSMVIPKACHHDQYNGLAIRFFFERFVNLIQLNSCIETAKLYLRNMVGEWHVYSYDEWVHHLGGKRMNMLINEPEATMLSKYVPVDIFVKLEAYLGKTPTNFKPRIIQGRQLAYQNVVGPFFYSVSKWLASVFHPSRSNLIYDNGIDARDLGEIASRCFKYKNVFEIDVSNWDGSLAPAWLRFEIWFIENCLPELPPRWRELKKSWRNVEGNGKNGVHFKTTHGRRSGDMWTSCFNSLINLMILVHIFGTDILAVAKGDDNFFGTNKNISAEEIVTIYAGLGMKAKVKKVDHISNLGYCSGTFWPVGNGWKWGVKPFRIISKLGLNLHRHPPKLHKRLLYGTALSMLPIASHVPLLSDLLYRIIETAKDKEMEPLVIDEPWKNTSSVIDLVDPMSYNIFAERYQMDIDDIDDLLLAVNYNLPERRKLSIDDFPIVFEDARFVRGFEVDTDEVCADCQHITIENKKLENNTTQHARMVEFVLNCLLSPLIEEVLRCWFPSIVSLFLGLFESLANQTLYNALFHTVSYLLMVSCGFGITLVVHFLHNVMVWYSRRERVGYGSLLGAVVGSFDSRCVREEQRFLPLCTIVRLLDKYRITCSPQNRRFWSFSVRLSNNSRNSSKKSGRTSGKTKVKSQRPKSQARSSLGRTLMKSGLGALGGMLGPAGALVGSSLGDWGANILGMGDYEVKNNTIMEGNGVPNMHKSNRGIVISHKEFLGDITGSIAFQNRVYTINPGSSITFPWLSNIAAMFQSYRIKGLIFEFVSTSADALNSVNTALGTVVMATQYNVALPQFVNKAEMEQYEYSVSGRPSRNLIHCVECDPSLQVMDHLFTRTGSIPSGQDYQFYDWGTFQFATVGMQAAATIGELWVSYEIEFLKPRIPSGGTWPGDFTKIANGPYVAASEVLGSIQTTPVGNLGVTIGAGASGWQRILFPSSISAGRFLVTVNWKGSSGVTVTYPVRTLSNLSLAAPWFSLNTASESFGPQNPSGGAVTECTYEGVVTVNGYSATGSYIEFGVAGTLPGTPVSVTIVVVALPLTDSVF